MADGPDSGRTDNELSGIVIGPAILGRNINVTLKLPPEIPPATSGMPPRSPTFTGRTDALDAVLATLRPPDDGPDRETSAVVVTATVGGMGGVGKTELAVQAAHAALAEGWFPGGVLFANLLGYDAERRRDPGDVLSGWLGALGVPGEYVPAEATDRTRMLRSILAEFARRGRRVLVVVDNVTDGSMALPLLPTDGACAAIVTSRHKLAMLDARLVDLDVLDDAAAVAMLDGVLRTARPNDDRIEAHPADALDLAHLCGGLPLALRITAALLAEDPDQYPADLAAELRDPHPLEGFEYGRDGVRRAFDLSYRHLSEEQRRVFRLLSVNPGPTVTAATVAAATDLTEPKARRHCRELARAHLLEPTGTSGRWAMHDLLRLFAEERGEEQAEPDGRAKALARVLEHLDTRVRAAVAHLEPTAADPAARGFADRPAALEWLDDELPNLSAAAHAATGPLPGLAVDIILNLGDYLSLRRRFTEWIGLAELARDTAHLAGDRHGEGRALNNLGIALQRVRRFEEAATAHEHAHALFRETGDRHGEGRAWNNLGLALQETRRFEEAITAHRHAHALFQETGDRHSEARTWNNLGIALQQVRRFEKAVTAHQHAHTLYQETGDRHGEARTWGNLGIALRLLRRFDEAITAHQRAHALFQASGDRHSEALALVGLARALLLVDRAADAASTFRSAAALFDAVGDEHWRDEALHKADKAIAPRPGE